MEIAQDEQDEDSADDDSKREELCEAVQQEIAIRLNSIGAAYPFRLSERGTYLEFLPLHGPESAIYLFCLFLSHVPDRSIIPDNLKPVADNGIRDLFQVCCTVAAAGHVNGDASCFGWPRPDGTDFLEALKALYTRIGIGVPHDEAPAGAPIYIKDGGIDIIAWCPAIDGMGVTSYFVAQAASGKGWSEKSVKNDEEVFHDFWFKHKVAAERTRGIFIPFCIEPDSPVVGRTTEEKLQGYLNLLTHRFGTVFYRYRIPEMAVRGLRRMSDGAFVDRCGELEQVCTWVDSYCSQLSRMAEG
ncbi:MAG: hypothetical protein M1274_13690 [Actinobacteria bacterium]|nr:hypothetical protein [Actinomycetota bacterium]